MDEWEITSRRVEELFQEHWIDSATYLALAKAIRAATAARRPPPLPAQVVPLRDADIAGDIEALGRASLPPPLVAARKAAAPRRSISEILSTFMERKNIRWGELVGGLLIVGCSIALVLSFWAQIQQRPVMKFSIFTAVTAALFGVGLYSEHRWKLPTTSRGILLIAMLLVPLNLMAFAAFSHGAPIGDPVALAGATIAFLLFLALAWAAARVLTPLWPVSLTAGVMVLSAASLVVRFVSSTTGTELSTGRMFLLAIPLVACYDGAASSIFLGLRRRACIDAACANAALLSLGVMSFALVFPFALIVTCGDAASLHHLSPLIGVAGLPPLIGGAVLGRRLDPSEEGRLGTTATGVSVAGAMLAVVSIALSWPSSIGMLAASLVAFAAFMLVAIREESTFWFAAAQTAAIFAALAGVVFCLDPRADTTDELVRTLSSIETWKIIAIALAALSLAWGVLRAFAFDIRARSADARPTSIVAACRLACLPQTLDRVTSIGLLLALTMVAMLAAANEAPLAITQGVLPWLLLALLLAYQAIDVWAQRKRRPSPVLLLTAWVACPLLAAQFQGNAGAAFRWANAGYLLLAWFVVRASARAFAHVERETWAEARTTNVILLLLGIAPIVMLSVIPAGFVLSGSSSAEPGWQSTLASLGPISSFVAPLLAVAAFFFGQARRLPSDAYVLPGVLSINLLASNVYLAAIGAGAMGDFRSAHWVRLAQLNAAICAIASLIWLARGIASRPIAGRFAPPVQLAGCLWASLVLNALLILPATCALFLAPESPASFAAPVADIWGWAGLGVSICAAAILQIVRWRSPINAACASLLLLAALSALTAQTWDRGNWLAFHVWLAGQTAAAWAIIGLGWWLERSDLPLLRGMLPDHFNRELAPHPHAETGVYDRPDFPEAERASADKRKDTSAVPLNYHTADGHTHAGPTLSGPTAHCAAALGVMAVILALRGLTGDPFAPWPSTAAIIFVGLLAAALAVLKRSPVLLYPASALVNLSATIAYCVDRGALFPGSIRGLLEMNVLALALPAMAWLVLELHVFRRGTGGSRRTGWPPVHRFAAVASVVGLGWVTIAGFIEQATTGSAASPLLDAAAFTAAAGLLIACLWETWGMAPFHLLYILGLIAGARALSYLNLPPDRLAWAAAPSLAAYALLTGTIYALRHRLRPVAKRIGLPGAGPPATWEWLNHANMALAGAVLGLAFWADLTFADFGSRAGPALAALMTQVALWLLDCLQPRLRRIAIVFGAVGLIASAWAALQPTGDNFGLLHTALATAILVVVAVAISLALAWKASVTPLAASRTSDPDLPITPPSQQPMCDAASDRAESTPLAESLRAVMPLFGASALISLAAVTGLEVWAQCLTGRVESPGWAIAVVAASIAACCVTAVVLALRPPKSRSFPTTGAPGHHVATPSTRQTACVYAAEALLALLFVHVRLAMPFLFHGLLQAYWPIIVMGVAFAGVGVGHALRRRGVSVFADPLQQTGAFLPLLPAIGFWVAASRVDFSILLLLAGALYASLSFLRRSTLFGMLAALAGNGALWYLLRDSESLGLFVHPQLWVIPAALSFLAAVELNRGTLSDAQLRAARYGCLVAAYLSSTADIVINGAAHSPWLPIILAGLSVAGVLAGVTFRVRPFLFLGTGFLSLAVVAMIYNAAANLGITWIWYVAGIVLGLSIIVLFAVFEKKHVAMIGLIEQLKGWQ